MKKASVHRVFSILLSFLLILPPMTALGSAESAEQPGKDQNTVSTENLQATEPGEQETELPELNQTEPEGNTEPEPGADSETPAEPPAEEKGDAEEPVNTASPEEPAEEAEAAVSLAAAEEKYPRDENGNFLVVENYVDKIDLVPDSKLFGVYENGKWKTAPLLNYDYSVDMEPIREAAMKGDYESAKIELLEYYRLVKARRPVQPLPSVTQEQLTLGRLLDYNVLRNSNSAIKYLNTFQVAPEEREISVDLKASISKVLATPILKLVSVRRDGSRLQFRDRTAGGAAPRIEMVINGEQKVFYPVADGTIRAGSLKGKSFPDEHYLYAQESKTAIKTITTADKVIEDWHEPSPFDENTERTLMKFDLSGVDASQNIQSMVFKVTAQALNTDESKEVLMMVLGDSAWTEKNLCWNSYEHLFACYDGEPYIRFNQPLPDKYSDRYRDELQRLRGYLDYAANAYLALENKEEGEVYARRSLTQVCGFFDQLGNVPTMAYTNYDIHYESIMHGRNNLDVGSRANAFVPMMFNLIDSRHMSPEIWTSFVKYAYRTADFLNKKSNWDYKNNWGSIETAGLYNVTMNFREFTRSDEFLNTFSGRNYNGELMGGDFASNEVPVSYVTTNLSALYDLQNIAERVGENAPYAPEAYNQLIGLSKYVAFASGPGFVSVPQGDGTPPDKNMVATGVVKSIADFTGDSILRWAVTNGKEGTPPAFTSHRYTSNQHYIMRTGWDKNDLFMQTNMDGGYYSHPHQDDLGVIVFAHGKYLLADPGFDSYETTKPSTVWLKSTKAHNTVEVNGRTQNTPRSQSSMGKSNEWLTSDAYDYFNGTVTTNSSAAHTRNILFIKDGYWIVTDYLKPNNTSSNQYIQTWHMTPDAGIAMDSDSKQVRTNFDDVNMIVAPVDQAEYTRSEIKAGLYGGGTSVLSDADYVEYEKKGKGNTRFSTVLVPENTGENFNVQTEKLELSDVKDEGAAAMQIYISGEKERAATYYTVNDFKQAADRTVGNYETNGTMMYVENLNGKLSKIYAQDANKKSEGLYVKDADSGQVLLESSKALPAVAVEQSGSLIKLYTNNNANQVLNTISYSPIDLSALKIYAPQYTGRVLVNGKPEDFYKRDGYLYFGSGTTDENRNTGNQGDSGSGHGGGSGGGGGGGSFGGGEPGGNSNPGATNPPAVQPSPGTDEYKTLLKQSVEGHWAEKEISSLIDAGIVEGDSGELRLNETVSRAEFTAMMARSIGLSPAEYGGGFADVAGDAWYAGIIQAAYDKGVIQGDGASFRPDDPITREEMAVIAAKIAKAFDVAAPPDTTGGFEDEGRISDWSKEYVDEASRLGLIRGFEDGSFQPEENSLREQAMVIAYRLRALLPSDSAPAGE